MFTWERIVPKLDHLSNQTQLLLTFVETKTICLVLINISTRIDPRNLSKSNELVWESGFWEICSYPKEWCWTQDMLPSRALTVSLFVLFWGYPIWTMLNTVFGSTTSPNFKTVLFQMKHHFRKWDPKSQDKSIFRFSDPTTVPSSTKTLYDYSGLSRTTKKVKEYQGILRNVKSCQGIFRNIKNCDQM